MERRWGFGDASSHQYRFCALVVLVLRGSKSQSVSGHRAGPGRNVTAHATLVGWDTINPFTNYELYHILPPGHG